MRSPAGGAEPLPYAPQDTLSLGPAFSTARPGFFPHPRQGTRALPYKVLRYRARADRVVRPYNPFVGAMFTSSRRIAPLITDAGRRGRRPLRNSIGKHPVGDDAHIVPPGLIPHLLLTVSLRSQCAHWLWQSVLLVLCAGVLRIPTTSLRTGLGMTRKFFRLPSLRGRNAPVAIRTPRPLAPLAKPHPQF